MGTRDAGASSVSGALPRKNTERFQLPSAARDGRERSGEMFSVNSTFEVEI